MSTLYPCPFDIRIYGEDSLLSNGSSQDGTNGAMNGRPTSTRMTSDSRTLTRSSTAVLSANDDFPIFFEDKHKNVVPVRSDLSSFIALDLDVSRINVIHNSLWACGRPLKARSLHRQKVLGREIVISEQCDLHLLYHSEVIYIKPLPSYLLDHIYWTKYLGRRRKDERDLYKDACGFLMSYVWLIRSKEDYEIAKHHRLVPEALTWPAWKQLVSEFIVNISPESLDKVNKRYYFGELRLDRINTIYRIAPRFIFTSFVRGYLYGYNRYSLFFRRNFGWVIVGFGFFSLILSAMQVAGSLPILNNNDAFQNASYGFIIFSCVFVALLLLIVVFFFAVVFFFNMLAALNHVRKAQQHRAKALAKNASKTG